MTITEPMTMVTDYVLTMACFTFAGVIAARSRRLGGRRVALWVAAFLATGVAALVGGTSHGFRVPLGEHWITVWRVTLVAIGAGSVLLIAAGIRSAAFPEAERHEARREGHGWLRRAVAVTLVALLALVLRVSPHPHFNHNDLYHVVQLAALYCLFRGALRLHELTPS